MRRRGFTLIEVIVVISIVAMLVSLILPAVQLVKDRARAVVCQSNIRQLQLIFREYEADHGTMPYGFSFTFNLPPPGWYMADLSVDVPGWYWANYLGTIRHAGRRDQKILQCPSKHLEDYRLQRAVLSGNYGVNRSVCRSGNEIYSKYEEAFGGPPISTSTIRRPAETLLLVDSGYALVCWWQARDDPLMELASGSIADTAYIPGLSINQERELRPGQGNDAKNGRHPGKTVNVGYVDGHVERKKADDLLVRKTGEETYNNLTPLWEPNPKKAN